MIWEAFPDATVAIEEMVAEGDLIAFRYAFGGTHRGAFQGMMFIRLSGDQIVERWSLLDMLDLMRQIGAAQ